MKKENKIRRRSICRPMLALCLILLLHSLISACSSTQTIKKPPPYRFAGTTISKDVDTSGSTGVPVEATDRFSTTDSTVCALLNFENLTGKHKVRWDWYDPDGNLYYSTGNTKIKTASDSYLREATAWHKLTIKGDKAETLPGDWEVRAFFDNEMVESKRFSIQKKTPEIASTPASSSTSILAPAPVMVSKVYPKDWGLVIGIEDYAHLPKVQFARKDALVVKEYFRKVMGVPEENIITLIDSDATKARIRGYIKKYLPSNVEQETTLYVYFAGHGAPDMQKGDPYLIPYDGDSLFIEETGYKLREFYDHIDALEINQAYVFLDSCFSGVATRAAEMLSKGTRPALIKVQNIELATQEVIAISAATTGQTSNSYPKEEHGLFTYYLLKALSGKADDNEDNRVTIKEIYAYVNKHVTRTARRMGFEQTPVISPVLDNLKDVSVARVVH